MARTATKKAPGIRKQPAKKAAAKRSRPKKKAIKLRNISEIRRHFHRNRKPVSFISATNFNLLGVDEWVRNFKFINDLDCYDGRHPNVLCPTGLPHPEFQSIEDINNYLLQHKEIVDYVEGRGKEGYRSYFGIDYLIDTKTNELCLGELNPRITGASSMSNHATFAHADAPLFLFHLLEFDDAPFELDIKELNARWTDPDNWADPDNVDPWSQMVIKHTEDTLDIVTHAPQSGIWRMEDDGSVHFSRFDYHRRAVESEREAFFLCILKPGDICYEGADPAALCPGDL